MLRGEAAYKTAKIILPAAYSEVMPGASAPGGFLLDAGRG